VSGQRFASGNRSGFTLLELVVVVALVGLLAVLVLPSYTHFASNQRMAATAQMLVADLRVARQEAVTRRATITVTFAADDGACPQALGGSQRAPAPRSAIASYTILLDAVVIKRTCLPPDVAWWPHPPHDLAFRSVGTAAAAAAVTVRSLRTGRGHEVSVAAESGAVTDAPR